MSLDDQLAEDDLASTSSQLSPERFNPQEPLWEAPVKKSTTRYNLLPNFRTDRSLLSNILLPKNFENWQRNTRSTEITDGEDFDHIDKENGDLFGFKSLDSDDTTYGHRVVKRSYGDRFGNRDTLSQFSRPNKDDQEIWDQSFTGTSDGTIIRNLIHQDTSPSFGTLQEAKDEQNTINEIENFSRQSSVLPKELNHIQYGASDNLAGLDFSKMDISVGKLKSNFDNNGENSAASFLRRNAIPVKGHDWQKRNRDQIPRHHIANPEEYDHYPDFAFFPKLSHYPSYAESDRITPLNERGLEPFAAITPIAPAMISREDQFAREPIPPREAETMDEPPPVSEFIQSNEPAPIPELPSLREIPPISEQREPEPQDLNPKETFGN